MARARNIKPGFFTNDELAECEPLARLLFAGLWLHADREGRMEDRPKKIKAEILPYDDCDTDALLTQLAEHGFILRYSVEGKQFIQILKFADHQNPHMKEAASSIPAPDKNSASTVQAEEKTEAAVLNPSSLIPHPESLITESEASGAVAPLPRRARTRSSDWNEEFAEFWLLYPRRPGDSRAAAHKAFVARMASGATVQQILDGTRRYAAYVAAAISDPQYVKHASTFLGPDRHYESDWTIQPRASPTGTKPTAQQQTIANLQKYLERTGNGN